MGLRKAFIFLGLVFAATTLLLNGVIFGLAFQLSKLNGELRRTLQGDRAAVEVRIHLVEAKWAQRIYLETDDPRWREERDAAEERLYWWVEEAKEAASSPHTAEAAAELDRVVEEFRRETFIPNGTSLRLRPHDFAPVSDALTNYMEGIAEDAREDAMAARRWVRASFLIAGSALLLSLVGGIGATRGSWRLIYQPVIHLRRVLESAPVDPGIRASEEGPEEFAVIGAAINEMLEEAAEQQERQRTFLASITHDLRNPISVMKTAAALTARQTPAGRDRERAELVVRQAERMERLISDLEDVGRIEAGDFQLEVRDADLRELVLDTCRLFSGATSHTIACDTPDAPLIVPHDPTRISQVLNNLLSNAIKYSGDHSRVEVRLRPEPPWATIEVEDEGIGMRAEELKTIFEPFQRGRATMQSIPGVGLGLSVVRRLVRAHGGEIEVESEVGVGSTFRVRLPLAR